MRSARHGVFGFSDDSADRRVGDVDPALGEAEQRQAGLWIPTELVGASIRRLGAVEVADEAKEIAFDHACAGERSRVDGRGQPIAGASRFDECLGPRSLQFQHLRSMEEAVAAVEDELLLGVAPARERFGPRMAPGQVEEFRARVDHRAVRVTGHERRELTGLDRRHGLVEECRSLGDFTEIDQHASLTDPPQCDEVAIDVGGADLAGLDEVGARAGQVAGLEEPQHRQPVLDVTLLDAIDARVVEQASRALDPASAPADVSFETEPLPESHRKVRRPVHCAVVDAHLMGSNPVAERVLVVAGQVRRGCEPIEIVDVERVEFEARQQPVGVTPPVIVACRSCVLDGSHHVAQFAARPRVRRERPRPPPAARPGTSTSRRSDRLRSGTRRRCQTPGSCPCDPAWRVPTPRPTRRSRCRTAVPA